MKELGSNARMHNFADQKRDAPVRLFSYYHNYLQQYAFRQIRLKLLPPPPPPPNIENIGAQPPLPQYLLSLHANGQVRK